MARPLFILGASRSGTTALTNYMNQHEQILLCKERYKYVPEMVTPELLTFRRILDYEPQQGSGDTNIPRELHEELLAGKDPAKLKWIGDKGPGNAKRYREFPKNNPGAHFLITYRPIEEVVESFEERSRESGSPAFAGKDGLANGVAAWNRAMQSAREYLESHEEPNGLVVSYHDFFYHRTSDYARLLSEFLEIEFGDAILRAWENISCKFEDHRREKDPITEEKAAYIREHKDHAAEEWVLERIARQWSEPGLYKRTSGEKSSRRKLAAALMRERSRTKATGNTDHGLERDIKRLENKLTRERRNARTLRRENRNLDQQINSIQASRSWKLLNRLHHLRSAILETRSRAVRNSGARRVLAKLVRTRNTLSRRSGPLAKGLTGAIGRVVRQDSRADEPESGENGPSELTKPAAKQVVPEPATNEERELQQRRLEEHRERRKLQQRRLEEHKRRRNLQQRRLKESRIRNTASRLYALGFTERALEDLRNLAADDSEPVLQRLAAWELSLWHANQHSEQDARLCLELLPVALRAETDPARLRRAAVIEAECQGVLGNVEAARRAISRTLASRPHVDLFLANANLETSAAARLEWINKAVQLHGISRVSLDTSTSHPLLDSLEVETESRKRPEEADATKVSVIMPVYNSEKILPTALDSVLSQTWTNLEVLVVDDCSTDDTVSLVEGYAAKDSRVRLLRTEANGGPYVARNLGLKLATGEFVTCHDADDWSHPEKVEKQALHLLHNPSVVGNTSEQARVTPDLKFFRRGNPGFYVFKNMSSFMFRREPMTQAVGYWDRVRFGGDGEFIKRAKKVLGDESMIDVPTGPLSFVRQASGSLTGDDAFGLHGYLMGARKEYREAFTHLHDTADDLRYEFSQDARPFAVPEPMWPTREAKGAERRHFDVILASDFRFTGGTTSSNVEEVKAQRRMGLRTGLIQLPNYPATPRSIDQKVRELLDGDQVQMLAYGEKVSCDALILRHPSSVQEWQQFVPDVEVKSGNVNVIVNQTPRTDYGDGGQVAYTISRCEEHLQKHFGKPGLWHPIGPLVREALHRHHEEELAGITLADENWPNIIDVEEWRRESRPPRGEKPRIGRHSRDAPVKWPVDRIELLAVYPDSDDYEVHVLGGAAAPERVLGGLPENWRVLKFGEVHPREFLSTLDVFVYYTHPDLVEAFGRTIVEAMAVGVPVILPPVFRAVFGEAAVYAEPHEVKGVVDLLMSDDACYESQVELARNYVEKHFGYTKHAERLGKRIRS